MDKFTRSTIEDRAMIIAEVGGYNITAAFPLFRSDNGKRTLTYAGAVHLAQWCGIKIESERYEVKKRYRVAEKPSRRVKIEFIGSTTRLHAYTPTRMHSCGALAQIETLCFLRVIGQTMTFAYLSQDKLYGKQIARGLAFRKAVEMTCVFPQEMNIDEVMMFWEVCDATRDRHNYPSHRNT